MSAPERPEFLEKLSHFSDENNNLAWERGLRALSVFSNAGVLRKRVAPL
jgi:hypothetical protein